MTTYGNYRFKLSKSVRDNTVNILFLVSFLPVFIVFFLLTSMYYLDISNIVKYTAIAWMIFFVFIKVIIFDKFKLLEFFFWGISFLVIVISSIKTRDLQLIIMCTLLFGCKNINPRLFVGSYMMVGLSLLFFIMYSAKIGIIPSLIYSRNGLMRYSFGIIYPTDFAAHIFYFSCGYLFIFKNKRRVFNTILLLGIAYIVYKMTDARFDAFLIVLLAFSNIFVVILDGRHFRWIWIFPEIFMVFIFVCSSFFDSNIKLLNFVNHVTSGRLSITNMVLNNFGLSLTGQRIVENGWGGQGANLNTNIYQYSYVDSGYMRLLIIYGVLAAILVLTLLSVLIKKSFDSLLVFILLLVAVSAIFEQHFLDLAYNPFFIAALSGIKFIDKKSEIIMGDNA